MSRRRRVNLARIVLAGWAIGCALAAPGGAVVAVGAPGEPATAGATHDGRDARALRLGLLGLLGLALGGVAVVQYRASAALALTRPPARRRGPKRGSAPVPAAPLAVQEVPMPPSIPPPAPAPPPPLWRADRPAALPIALASRRRAPITPPTRAIVAPPPRSPAQEACARAIGAANRYDRRATREGFAAALAEEPAIKPSAVPGFWEMPPGGHADLARAYLACGQRLDARAIVSMALMTAPHDRELGRLLREIGPYRVEESA